MTITLVSLSPKQVYENQVRLQKESDLKKESEKKKTSENQKEKKTEKNERENKKTNSTIERKAQRKTNLYAKASETKRMMFLNQPMIILLYKEA